MLDSVLRVYGESFDVEAFLAQHPIDAHLEAYNIGDTDILGGACEHSGFDALISETADAQSHQLELYAFLEKHKNSLLALKAEQAQCVLDIGLGLALIENNGTSANSNIVLSSKLISLCNELGLSIEFSAYPQMDETLEEPGNH
ncbi:hypothetical protein [Agaribacterium sp. ZY112]|uniref:hypothetical protein n=1 Tax=Agaribacterium sp. ZY112 TaxID=3233574 RepID=UPI0035245C2F